MFKFVAFACVFSAAFAGSVFNTNASLPLQRCPDGTDHSIRDNKCYSYHQGMRTFIDALSYCRDLRGHLASFSNAFDNELVSDHAKHRFHGQSFYIGANTVEGKSKTWKWTYGDAVEYNNWAVITVASEVLQCATANPYNLGKWSQSDCFMARPFVCEVQIDDLHVY